MAAATAELQSVRLQHTADGHHKEYRIDLDYEAATVTLSWGRIGFVVNTQVKEFTTGSLAMEFAEDKLTEKVDKGYTVVDDETAAGPIECDLTTTAAQAGAPAKPADDDRIYLLSALDCNGDWLGLLKDEDGGLSSRRVVGSQALLDTLTSLKTGWFTDHESAPVRHRIARFNVTFATAGGGQRTEYYYRQAGLVLTPSDVLLMACERCGHAQDEETLRVTGHGTLCDECTVAATGVALVDLP